METFESEQDAYRFYTNILQDRVEKLRKNISKTESYEIEKIEKLYGSLCPKNHEDSMLVKFGIRQYYLTTPYTNVKRAISIDSGSLMICCICKKCFDEKNTDSQPIFFD